MFKFQLSRMLKDYIGHVILITLPIVLIIFMNFVYDGEKRAMVEASTFLTIGFALTFQIYGASFGYQSLGNDFFTPMRDRLNAAPVNPKSIIIAILSTSAIVIFLQTIVILGASVVILKTSFTNLIPTLIIMVLSIIVAQLLGAVVLLLSGKVKTATSIMMMYAILSPFIAGIYFDLPNGIIFDIMSRYITTLSLAQTAIYGIINSNTTDILIGVISLVSIIVVCIVSLQFLTKRVAS